MALPPGHLNPHLAIEPDVAMSAKLHAASRALANAADGAIPLLEGVATALVHLGAVTGHLVPEHYLSLDGPVPHFDITADRRDDAEVQA